MDKSNIQLLKDESALRFITNKQRNLLRERDSMGWPDWTEETLSDLVELLSLRTVQLEVAFSEYSTEHLIENCVQVANLAMFIAVKAPERNNDG